MAFGLDSSKAETRNLLKKKSKSLANIAQHHSNATTDFGEQPWTTCHYNTYTHGMSNPCLALPERITSRNPPPIPSQFLQTSQQGSMAATPGHTRIDPVTGHTNVTIPAPPPRRYSLSELEDLNKLPPDSTVRSPSGNLLSIAQAKLRGDRPLTIEQRQKEIKQKVAAQQAAVRQAEAQKAKAQKAEAGEGSGRGNQVEVIGNFGGKKHKEKGERRAKLKQKWSKFLDSFCVNSGEEN